MAKSQLKLSKCLIKGQTNTNFIQGRDQPEKKTAITPNFFLGRRTTYTVLLQYINKLSPLINGLFVCKFVFITITSLIIYQFEQELNF